MESENIPMRAVVTVPVVAIVVQPFAIVMSNADSAHGQHQSETTTMAAAVATYLWNVRLELPFET